MRGKKECQRCVERTHSFWPLWGGIAFLLSTLVFGILGFLLIALLFNPFSVLGLTCEGTFFFVLIVFIGGIRIFIDAAYQVDIKQRT